MTAITLSDRSAIRRLLDFPNPVNETSARLVAGGVVLLAGVYVLTGWLPVLVVLAYGFVARVATGPTLSPLGRLVTGWVTPRLEARIGRGALVPGPPKRFAQGMGATLSVAALVADLAGAGSVAVVLVAMIVVAATLESAFGYCLGCTVFAGLMRVGVIPESVCENCADISARLTERSASPA